MKKSWNTDWSSSAPSFSCRRHFTSCSRKRQRPAGASSTRGDECSL